MLEHKMVISTPRQLQAIYNNATVRPMTYNELFISNLMATIRVAAAVVSSAAIGAVIASVTGLAKEWKNYKEELKKHSLEKGEVEMTVTRNRRELVTPKGVSVESLVNGFNEKTVNVIFYKKGKFGKTKFQPKNEEDLQKVIAIKEHYLTKTLSKQQLYDFEAHYINHVKRNNMTGLTRALAIGGAVASLGIGIGKLGYKGLVKGFNMAKAASFGILTKIIPDSSLKKSEKVIPFKEKDKELIKKIAQRLSIDD